MKYQYDSIRILPQSSVNHLGDTESTDGWLVKSSIEPVPLLFVVSDDGVPRLTREVQFIGLLGQLWELNLDLLDQLLGGVKKCRLLKEIDGWGLVLLGFLHGWVILKKTNGGWKWEIQLKSEHHSFLYQLPKCCIVPNLEYLGNVDPVSIYQLRCYG